MSYKYSETGVIILGSGTCVPSLNRSSCSVLILEETQKMLLDVGAGTVRRLLEAGIQIRSISDLLLSHFHPDHSGELPTFLFANKYPETDPRESVLRISGGHGLKKFYAGLRNAFGRVIELPEPLFELIEFRTDGPDTRQFDRILVETLPVVHRPESVAYRFTMPSGKTLVYSGDTGCCRELIELSRNSDLLICECSFPDGSGVRGHLTPSLAGKIATRAEVKKLVLTHFYPQCERVDIKAQCRMTYGGPLVLATDLMRITL